MDGIIRFLQTIYVLPAFHATIHAMTKLLMTACEKRGRVLKITGTDGPEDIYLIRYYVFKSKYFNFFIHQFLRSDRDDFHDHPWDFCTYLVSGAYTEEKGSQLGAKDVVRTRRTNVLWGRQVYFRNILVFRKATDRHRVMTDFPWEEKFKDFAPLTLCFTGPTKRTWGFIRDGKWVDWREYLGIPGAPDRG